VKKAILIENLKIHSVFENPKAVWGDF